MRSVGIDLHKNMFIACYLEKEGKEFRQFSIHELARFKESLERTDRLAVEATGNSRYFASQVQDAVCEVMVVNPKQFRVIGDSVKKTDKEDAEMLAFF